MSTFLPPLPKILVVKTSPICMSSMPIVVLLISPWVMHASSDLLHRRQGSKYFTLRGLGAQNMDDEARNKSPPSGSP